MALNTGILGLGTTLGYGVTPTLLANVTSCKWSPEVHVADTTSLSSTAMENVPVIVDFGTVDMDVIYLTTDTGHVHLRTLLGTPVVESWVLTYAKATGQTTVGNKESFSGTLTKFDVTIVDDDVVKAAISIKITGPVTPTTGS